MNYYLYKIRFTTDVHFGGSDSAQGIRSSEDHFRADTLFSAICQTFIQKGSNLEDLLDMVRKHEFLLTDSMPYKGEELFIPKPIMRFETDREIPAEKRKTIKNIRWIPVTSDITEYEENELFGSPSVRTQAAISNRDISLPYDVGVYSFAPDCGLYFIAALKDEAKESWLSALISSIGLSGIGGRISSGLGKFEIDDTIYLNEPFDDQTEILLDGLEDTASTKQMMLTSALPNDEELQTVMETASFQVVRRGGFVQSDSFNKVPLKKKTQYYLSAGSIVRNRFDGDLFQVGEHGSHPVYRYSVPVFMGVKA